MPKFIIELPSYSYGQSVVEAETMAAAMQSFINNFSVESYEFPVFLTDVQSVNPNESGNYKNWKELKIRISPEQPGE